MEGDQCMRAKVKDLIETLQTMNPELPVKVVACDDGEHVVEGYLSKDDLVEDIELRNDQKVAKITYFP